MHDPYEREPYPYPKVFALSSAIQAADHQTRAIESYVTVKAYDELMASYKDLLAFVEDKLDYRPDDEDGGQWQAFKDIAK